MSVQRRLCFRHASDPNLSVYLDPLEISSFEDERYIPGGEIRDITVVYMRNGMHHRIVGRASSLNGAIERALGREG